QNQTAAASLAATRGRTRRRRRPTPVSACSLPIPQPRAAPSCTWSKGCVTLPATVYRTLVLPWILAGRDARLAQQTMGRALDDQHTSRSSSSPTDTTFFASSSTGDGHVMWTAGTENAEVAP